jgi:hypothetical protein
MVEVLGLRAECPFLKDAAKVTNVRNNHPEHSVTAKHCRLVGAHKRHEGNVIEQVDMPNYEGWPPEQVELQNISHLPFKLFPLFPREPRFLKRKQNGRVPWVEDRMVVEPPILRHHAPSIALDHTAIELSGLTSAGLLPPVLPARRNPSDVKIRQLTRFRPRFPRTWLLSTTAASSDPKP